MSCRCGISCILIWPFRIDSAGHSSHELKFDSVYVKYGIWTGPDREGSFQFYQSSDTLRLNPSTQERFLYLQHVYQCEISGFTEKLELLSFQTLWAFFLLWTHSSGKRKKLICFPRYLVVTSPKNLAYYSTLRLDFQSYWGSGCLSSSQLWTKVLKTTGNRP